MVYYPHEFLELANEALEDINLNGENALMLLLNTCAQESSLGKYNRQKGASGLRGAFGIMQIELATEQLIYDNFLENKPNLKVKIENLLDNDYNLLWNLQYNDKYNIAMARCLYRSIQKPLPPFGDIEAQAHYWKDYYNRNGKGTVEQFINSFKTLVQPYL